MEDPEPSPVPEPSPPSPASAPSSGPPEAAPAPRRSARERNAPDRLELNSKGKTYANAVAYGQCSVGLRGGELCADQAYVQNEVIEVSPKFREVHTECSMESSLQYVNRLISYVISINK